MPKLVLFAVREIIITIVVLLIWGIIKYRKYTTPDYRSKTDPDQLPGVEPEDKFGSLPSVV